ncbi:hypothetical protein FA15DRAFT_653496 [Coprinopsis marcescibilis]|uniref:Galectin n=1 Tax=Coprinopsis marcescibilis TaxID=230819 RepID=A0A5C3L3M0_COPMA|nr:hypothetical protein FA15DRAFT_653496 [Coprinopsis marcescibilis]
MVILLNANQISQLGKEFTRENIIIVQSPKLTFTDSQTATDFNLLDAAEDVLLVIGIRPNENIVVFNSRTVDGAWGTEERIPLAGELEGDTPSIAIYDHGDRYQILLNLKTVLYYNKRILESGAAFGYSQGSDVAFGDTLALEFYDSLADIIPRLSGSN